MAALWQRFQEDSQRQRGALRQARQSAAAGNLALLLHGHRRLRDGTARLYAPDPATLQQALAAIGFTPAKRRRTAKSWALPAWATARALALASENEQISTKVNPRAYPAPIAAENNSGAPSVDGQGTAVSGAETGAQPGEDAGRRGGG